MPTKLPRIQVTLPIETYRAIKGRSKKDKISMSKIIVLALLAFLATGCSKPDQAKGPGLMPGQVVTVCPQCATKDGLCPC